MNRPLNKSLAKKRAARMAAVQALYAQSVSGGKPDVTKMLSNIMAHWKDSLSSNEPDLAVESTPDSALLEKILRAAILGAETIEEQIDGLILPGWKKERMSPVLMSCLRAFGGEMLARPDCERIILIDEYSAVAASFVSEQEHGFMHSALNHLARGLRVT
jgi:transcription termination factor NusB